MLSIVVPSSSSRSRSCSNVVHMLILQVGFWFLAPHADVCFTLSNHMFAFFFFFK